jgi:hypothetical protein
LALELIAGSAPIVAETQTMERTGQRLGLPPSLALRAVDQKVFVINRSATASIVLPRIEADHC